MGLVLNNDKNVSMENVTFKNCILWTGFPFPDNININNCTFINSGILPSYQGGIEGLLISNSIFTNSIIKAVGSYGSKLHITDNCIFNGNNNNWLACKSAINLIGIEDYLIDNSSIENYIGNGVLLEHCGLNPNAPNNITRNFIKNCGTGSSENQYAGIYILNSQAEIKNNTYISSNKNGIVCTDNSNVSISGNMNAQHVTETQNIKDNNVYQIMSTVKSFPYNLQWNAIYNNNINEPLIYYTGNPEGSTLNIKNNFWGDLFDPEEPEIYFSPVSIFNWEPYWLLDTGPITDDEDKILFDAAEQNVKEENFVEAKANYIQVAENYPSSIYAQASLKSLLTIEKFINNDYQSLKVFFLTNKIINNNEILHKIAFDMANWCEVFSENYQVAIDYFENIIDTTQNLEDSVFAIVNLEYIYYLMEAGINQAFRQNTLNINLPQVKIILKVLIST